MAFWNKWPYTSLQNLNLDWILNEIKKLRQEGLTLVDVRKDINELSDKVSTALMQVETNATAITNLKGTDIYTAKNADALGGKPPEAYSAVNLLDNSNFEIAQAGYNGTHGTSPYCADRWPASHSGVTISKQRDYITMTTTVGYQYIYQVLPVDKLLGDEFTFTHTRRGNLSARIAFYGKKSSSGAEEIKSLWLVGVDDWTPAVLHLSRSEFSSYDYIWILIRNESIGSIDYKNIGFYQGTYSTDKLPAYMPKSYAEELAECQRYYENSWFGTEKTSLYQLIGSCWNGSHFDVPIDFKQQKRVKPTMTYYPSGGRTAIQAFIKSLYRDVTILAPEYRMGLRGIYARVNVSEADLTIGYTYQLHAHWEASADL